MCVKIHKVHMGSRARLEDNSMGVRLSELEPGEEIILQISNVNDDKRQITMEAVISRSLRADVSLITLKSDRKEKLNFSNVRVAVEFYPKSQTPIRWKSAKIAHYADNEYLLQVIGEGMRHNRREAFRVGISKVGRMRRSGEKDEQVMIRDISVTGFSITDSRKTLNIEKGDEVVIYLDDIGYQLAFRGRAVRLVEEEEMNTYGFVITSMCQELEEYLAIKQRKNRNDASGGNAKIMR